MTGKEYLEGIRNELQAGRHQHRMGENLLRAFGYLRRRETAIKEINTTLEELGLIANPPINAQMPLQRPRIRFKLKLGDDSVEPEAVKGLDVLEEDSDDVPAQDDEDNYSSLLEPTFRVSELESANRNVKRVSPNASVYEAYSTMLLNKYSQLVVADHENPMQQDIKGIVSFQSMTKALMNGKPTTVAQCIESVVPTVASDTDLKTIVNQLIGNDVVLVIGPDKRLQGIVTASDLAGEFAQLVDPFRRIGEIEKRLRILVRTRLGKGKVADFLRDRITRANDATAEIEELTMGELQGVLEFSDHWNELGLPFERKVFVDALAKARDYRNRLMHFRDPLTQQEIDHLSNFCDMVRTINLQEPTV